MTNREESSLYCLFFDAPITKKQALISALKSAGCSKIKQGVPTHSLEFRLNDSCLEGASWIKWEKFIQSIHGDYKFNFERSCLPKQNIN